MVHGGKYCGRVLAAPLEISFHAKASQAKSTSIHPKKYFILWVLSNREGKTLSVSNARN